MKTEYVFGFLILMNRQVSYLQIQINEQINQIIQTISDKKEEITQSDAFGLINTPPSTNFIFKQFTF